MAIKMRNNTKLDSVCCECGETRKMVLDMFDLCIGGNIFTICDVCNEALFSKTLRAECYKNGRVKSKEDMAIIHRRARGDWKIKGAQELKRQQEAEAYYAKQGNGEDK
jgi:hypothetical protein